MTSDIGVSGDRIRSSPAASGAHSDCWAPHDLAAAIEGHGGTQRAGDPGVMKRVHEWSPLVRRRTAPSDETM
jgi:hypothetical protein